MQPLLLSHSFLFFTHMQIIERLEDFRQVRKPIVLTIGNFDGMHRGHRAVLQHAQSLVGSEGEVVVLTFRNHPSEVLKPESPIPLICTLLHKLRLLGEMTERVILLPFTRYLAKHSAYSFIEHVRNFIPFSYLVLGHDATLGRDRQGNAQVMREVGMEWGFTPYYLDEYRYEGKPVSSTRIRGALQEGNFLLVEELLDRPYSILGKVFQDEGEKTFKMDVTRLCLPPSGEYPVDVLRDSKRVEGVARVAFDNQLTVKLNQTKEDFNDKEVEIIFKS